MKTGISKGFALVGKAIKAGAKKIVAAIAVANTETLIKFGILLGVTTVTVAYLIKFLREKKQAYHSSENTTVVEEALGLNFNDPENIDKLHPLMKKVKKDLKKDLRPRKKMSKSARQSKKEFEKALKKIKERNIEGETIEEYDQRINREYDQFLKDMAFEDEYREEITKLWTQPDNYSLRVVWEEA